jgi:hypothetical protein
MLGKWTSFGKYQKIFMCILFTMGFEIDFIGIFIDSKPHFSTCQPVRDILKRFFVMTAALHASFSNPDFGEVSRVGPYSPYSGATFTSLVE